MAKPILIPIYNDEMGQYNITNLDPLVQNPYVEMGPQDWRATQVKLENIDFPPNYNIMMEKISSSVVYKKYVILSHSNEALKKNFESKMNQNHLFNSTYGEGKEKIHRWSQFNHKWKHDP